MLSLCRLRLPGLAAFAGAACLLASVAQASVRPVVAARIDGVIAPPTTDYLARALQHARRVQATCLLVELDTPGGRGDAMRDIARMLLDSPVAVVVYVTPRGARAGSAGAVIALAAHILAMAPQTTIGAAHPVDGGGGNLPSDMRDKVVSDVAAFARTLAERRGRSTLLADQMVRQSRSVSASEAVGLHVADIIAADRTDLLRQIDGRKVSTAAGEVTLATAGAPVQEEQPTWFEGLLRALFDPNVALILAVVAVFGILGEISNPGAILPGVTGGIALILSLYVFAVLSVNAAGIGLLALAITLFVADAHTPTHGILTAGGVVAFVLGGMMVFGDPTGGLQASPAVVVPLGLLMAVFFGTVVATGWRALRLGPGTGPETLVGARGEARTDIAAHGRVFIDGALWTASNVGVDPIGRGDAVTVTARKGLTLEVRRTDPVEAGPSYRLSTDEREE